MGWYETEKEKQKRLLSNAIKALRAHVVEERIDAHGYRKAAQSATFPSEKKLYNRLAQEEEEHARKLETLASELEAEGVTSK